MSSAFSPSWYRVAALKPRLPAHFEVHRQPFGNELTFLLQDHSTGKFYRFNANAYDLIGRMNGERTVHDIWEETIECQGDDAPGQEETIALLGRLHAVDALQATVTPDCLELFRRSRRLRTQGWKRLVGNPLAVKVPLMDPDRVLSAMLPAMSPVFGAIGLAAWLTIVAWAMLVAAAHWHELGHAASTQALDPANLVLLGCLYPVVKALHELGHAITTKKWGGEVHEVGITFLVLLPVPYVDASAASAIRSKYRRMAVSAAGMMVELFLAAIALLVWLSVEPGMVRSAAFNVMLIGSVSTVVFNGNPLLRFDAYYILKDAVEVPNLASRSTRYVGYLVKRYLLDVRTAESPATRPGERGWLICYGIGSTGYRLLITFGIILFVAGKFFIVGVLLALWATLTQVVLPVVKLGGFVLLDRALEGKRARALTVTAATLSAALGVFLLVPLPTVTKTEGVLWLPERATVQPGTDGVVAELLAAPFAQVQVGQPLIALEDRLLDARIEVLEAELVELRARHRIDTLSDPVQAAISEEAIAAKSAELERERERADQLIVASRSEGVFVVRRASDLPGQLLRQGEAIGYVLDGSQVTIRVVVPQDRIGLVRENLLGVEVKLADDVPRTLRGRISRDVPAAQQRLPSRVLGSAGGGTIPVDPADEEGLTPLASVFLVDVLLEEAPPAWRVGQRAYVKFDHGAEPLAQQWLRLGRQLFLRRFGV